MPNKHTKMKESVGRGFGAGVDDSIRTERLVRHKTYAMNR